MCNYLKTMSELPYPSDRHRAEMTINKLTRRGRLTPCIAAIGLAAAISANNLGSAENLSVSVPLAAAMSAALAWKGRRTEIHCNEAVTHYSIATNSKYDRMTKIELSVSESGLVEKEYTDPIAQREPGYFINAQVPAILFSGTGWLLGNIGYLAAHGSATNMSSGLGMATSVGIAAIYTNTRHMYGVRQSAHAQLDNLDGTLAFTPPSD